MAWASLGFTIYTYKHDESVASLWANAYAHVSDKFHELMFSNNYICLETFDFVKDICI